MAKNRYCMMCDAWMINKECPDCGDLTLSAPSCLSCDGEGNGPSWEIVNCPACGGSGKLREPGAF
jgi:rRNA maturation protein Nop10